MIIVEKIGDRIVGYIRQSEHTWKLTINLMCSKVYMQSTSDMPLKQKYVRNSYISPNRNDIRSTSDIKSYLSL